MAFDETSIGRAGPGDAAAIAQVHVESARSTYRGILPESWLDRLSLPERTRQWTGLLASTEERRVALVGRDAGGRVVGFICGGPERTGGLACDGEIYVIYLLEEAQRQGLGTRLVWRLAEELRTRGFGSMAVWVLERNPSARFYEAMGGKAIARKEVDRDGETFVEVAYGWKDWSELRGRSEA